MFENIDRMFIKTLYISKFLFDNMILVSIKENFIFVFGLTNYDACNIETKVLHQLFECT